MEVLFPMNTKRKTIGQGFRPVIQQDMLYTFTSKENALIGKMLYLIAGNTVE